MAEPTEREIMNRAYQLWERAGRPENREDEFWHAAQQDPSQRGQIFTPANAGIGSDT